MLPNLNFVSEPHYGFPSIRISSVRLVLRYCEEIELLSLCAILVPLGAAAVLAQASIYDVPGGYRAVMFDRFSGVKNEVRGGHTRIDLIPTS